MKPGLRISVKDYRRGKGLKVLLVRVPYAARQFWVRMNGQPWPKDGRPVSLTRVLASLRKALVAASASFSAFSLCARPKLPFSRGI
jgi:hypothetical protein